MVKFVRDTLASRKRARMPRAWKDEGWQMAWCRPWHEKAERFLRQRLDVFDADGAPREDCEEFGQKLVRA